MPKTFNIRPIEPVKRVGDETWDTSPIADGETFLTGSPVLKADGRVEECAADPTEIAGFSEAAAADYAWKADTFGFSKVAVPVAKASQEFRGTMLGVYATADLNSEFGLVKDASGYWCVDKSETTTATVVVLGVDDEVEVGDTNPPVRFTVLPANRQEV